MEIKSLICPSCGAPVKTIEGATLATCEYCGHQILIEMKGKTSTIDGTQNTISRSDDRANREFKVLQITNEITALQGQLANLRAEKRQLERERSPQKRKQLQQINREEEDVLRRKALLEVELVAIGASKTTALPQKSSAVSPMVPAGITLAAVANYKMKESAEISDKSKSTALWLSIFTGFLGVHRFYTGHILSGLLQFFTIGGFMVWWVIDIISIARGTFRDSQGRLLDTSKPVNPLLKSILLVILVSAIINGILQNAFGYSANKGPEEMSEPILILSFIIGAAVVNIKSILKFITSKIYSQKS